MNTDQVVTVRGKLFLRKYFHLFLNWKKKEDGRNKNLQHSTGIREIKDFGFS